MNTDIADNRTKADLRGLTEEDLRSFAGKMGEAPFRGIQIFEWISKGAKNIKDMRNLPKSVKVKLKEKAYISALPEIYKRVSKIDETRKYLFETNNAGSIESVLMKYEYGYSACISSQAGCRMGCRFCASKEAGFRRNLTAGEMLGQVLELNSDLSDEFGDNERVSRIVVMGIGEPFDNYENLSKFIRIVTSPHGLNIGMRHITVSTCGIVPKIKLYGEDFPQAGLAVSLHATTDKARSDVMPINNEYGITELIEACRKYTEKTSRRITFEYTHVAGVNDTEEDAKRLAELLRGMLCHVNLIPLNYVKESGLNASENKSIRAFQRILTERGVNATIRRSLGQDIAAACGQLRAGELSSKLKGKENIEDKLTK